MDTQSQAFMNQRDLSGLFAQWAAADTPPSELEKSKRLEEQHGMDEDGTILQDELDEETVKNGGKPKESRIDKGTPIPF